MATKYKGEVISSGTPTQVVHPWQAVKRTVAVVIAALLLVNGVIALALEVFDVHLADTPLAGWLAGVSAIFALIVTFLQRLMVLEGLQDFLVKVGLGTGVEKEEPITEEPRNMFDGGPHKTPPPTPPSFSD